MIDETPTKVPAQPSSDPDLTLAILQFAVRVARDEQIRSLENLKRILASEFPGKDVEVKAALTMWGNYEAQKGNPRYRY